MLAVISCCEQHDEGLTRSPFISVAAVFRLTIKLLTFTIKGQFNLEIWFPTDVTTTWLPPFKCCLYYLKVKSDVCRKLSIHHSSRGQALKSFWFWRLFEFCCFFIFPINDKCFAVNKISSVLSLCRPLHRCSSHFKHKPKFWVWLPLRCLFGTEPATFWHPSGVNQWHQFTKGMALSPDGTNTLYMASKHLFLYKDIKRPEEFNNLPLLLTNFSQNCRSHPCYWACGKTPC